MLTIYKYLLTLLLIISAVKSFSQSNYEKELVQKIQLATTNADKIDALTHLTEYYFSIKDFSKGDSIIERQFMIAEASRDRQLILNTYFENTGYNFYGLSTRNRSEKTLGYIIRAMNYARTIGSPDYIALAYSNLARLQNTEGKLDEAFNNANLGFTTALSSNNDSVKVICGVELGNIYVQQGKMVLAFKTYTNAYDIAVKSKSIVLQSVGSHAFSDLYKKLKRTETAKEHLFRSLDLNKKHKYLFGLLDDYISLAQLYPYAIAKDYLFAAEHLADSLKANRWKLDAQRKLFSYMMLEEKPEVALEYLEKNVHLKNFMEKTGPHYLDWVIASVYLYGNKPDTALSYFKKAEPAFNDGYDFTTKKGFFGEMAYCYQMVNDIPNAILYYHRSIELSKEVSDYFSIKNASNELRKLYSQQNNFEKAYQYSILYNQYKDTLDQVSKDRDLALLEIDNENKIRQQEEEFVKEQKARRHSLQYMAITIIIATAFILLVALGMFKTSPFTIRALGFLSLIFLFEFIIMMLDHWIHDITHGEPVKIWLIKIGIISILLPLHHYIEHKVIHYLLSYKLLKLRSDIKLFKFFSRDKKAASPVTPEEADIPKN